jgi:hypothetical protein
VNGKPYQAQVSAKGDRLRLEYQQAIRTDFRFATIGIIPLGLSEIWQLLAQQKELLAISLEQISATGSRRHE